MLLVDLIAPPSCLACRAPGRVLCGSCRVALPWLIDPCPRCALPRAGGRCERCPARRQRFAAAWAPVAHEGPARELVLALKLHARLAAADAIAAQMAARLPAALREGAIVAVPADPARLRRRGFDPADRIARALARRTGMERVDCLRRRPSATRQLGAPRRQRLRGPGGAIEAVRAPPAVALVVDDVHTTGATFDACAAALRSAGSRVIHVASYARTLRRA